MKTITPSLRGLASSLLLNVGLNHAAEKLDPVAGHQTKCTHAGSVSHAAAPCIPCLTPMPRR